jgi:hypothetical protein
MIRLAPRLLLISSFSLALVSATATSQMVSPQIDREPGPFSYFSKPTDELGVMNATAGSEITPEGFLYTGFGELMFFIGPDQTPVAARIRTLEEGCLPIVSYTVSRLGIDYKVTLFAASTATGQIIDYARVTLHNPDHKPRAAFFATAFRFQGEQTTEQPTGDNRFSRPIAPTGVGQFNQPGETFSKDWVYSMNGGTALRNGRIVYTFPTMPTQQLALTLRSHYNRVKPVTATKLNIEPTTPTDVVSYKLVLQPGERKTLDFKVPLRPVTPGTAALTEVQSADFDEAHRSAVELWHNLLDRSMSIEVAETKVNDTFRASLVYDLLAIESVDNQTVQTVNEFQYHRFYLRDAADFVRMYDATGYSDIAAKVLSFFPSRQQSDGNFLSQPGQYDGWGEAMWAFGEHYRRTHDVEFANSVYPNVVRAVEWLIRARAADPLHVMPKSDVRDNEYVAAHLTGYNFLALDGLQSAIELARATNHPADAQRFQREYDDYHRVFFALLDKVTATNGGYIPPALDADGWPGTDWGNLLSVTPEPVLDPHDPRVTATLEHTMARYQEGITTYSEPDDGEYLHHYLTIKNTLTEIIRDGPEDQHQAIREFYAELLHTSSTHAGFEYAIRPWGSRDFEGNLAPHGWFAADYRNLLRNMLVREEGDTLHLLSAVSPEWIAAGKQIRVQRAPTMFGQVNFTLSMDTTNSASLTLSSQWQRAPHRLVLHLPWFMQIDSVTVDGARAVSHDNAVELPAGTTTVKLLWHRRPNASAMSYAKTVASYKAEYARRYEHLLTTGDLSPTTDTWNVPDK